MLRLGKRLVVWQVYLNENIFCTNKLSYVYRLLQYVFVLCKATFMLPYLPKFKTAGILRENKNMKIKVKNTKK
jgi:hypothetical protein